MKKLLKNAQVQMAIIVLIFWGVAYMLDKANGSLGQYVDVTDYLSTAFYVVPFAVALFYIAKSIIDEHNGR
jgi:hypothetical protein